MSDQEKAEQQKKELYYDPFPECAKYGGCDGCDKSECGQREESEDECDFNGEECINSFLHHECGCVGCEVIAPPTKEELEECPDKCEDCSSLEVEEDNHGLRYPVCHKKEGKKS